MTSMPWTTDWDTTNLMVDPVVNTTKGPVQGTEDGNMNVFRGIPYAKPPVDDLRFKSPEEPAAWNDAMILDSEFTVTCPQLPANDPSMSEDCLYLNVFTPL